ncbi:Zinc finger BED domain-containing 4, partial [Brachionus plicatilis]
TKNNTRWNSIFYMLQSLAKLSNSEIESILLAGKKKFKKQRKNSENDNKFTYEEREKMNELILILKELEICTDILEGDEITISRILPTLFTVIMKIDLKSNHEALMAKDKTIKNKIFYFENVSKKLIASIKKRFEDIFDETIYNIAAMLDPNYGTIWIKPENKQSWISKLKSMSESWKDASKSKRKNRSPTSN